MNSDLLLTFLTVTTSKSFSQAARQLGVSQSAVSCRIKELERETEQQLFYRRHHSVELTTAGRTFVSYAEEILELQSTALKQMSTPEEKDRYLVIGMIHGFYECFFQNRTLDLRKALKGTPLQLFLKHSRDIQKAVVDQVYDLGISHHRCNFKNVTCRLLCRDEMLIVSGDVRPEAVRPITLEQLRQLPILSSSFLDAHVSEWLFGRHHVFEMEIDLAHQIIPHVLREQKYSYLPRRMVQPYLDKGTLKQVKLLNFQLPPAEYYLLYNCHNPRLASFLSWIEEQDFVE